MPKKQDDHERRAYNGTRNAKPRPATRDMPAELRSLLENSPAGDEYLKVYRDGLVAMRTVITPTGRTFEEADHQHRLKTAEALADRLYGKPKVSAEITGGLTIYGLAEIARGLPDEPGDGE